MNRVNQPAVPFALPDPSGKVYRLADFAGSWLLLVFPGTSADRRAKPISRSCGNETTIYWPEISR